MNEEQRKIKEKFEQKQREEARRTIKEQKASTKKVLQYLYLATIANLVQFKNVFRNL